MDGRARNGRRLRSIIALLLSLASVADAAAGRAFPIRWLVLAILRRGERAAQVYVAEAMQVEWADLKGAMEAGVDPGDAALLAWRFRWFAAVLGALLEQLGGGIDGWTSGRDSVPGRIVSSPGRHLAVPGGRAVSPYDTS